MRKKIRAFLCRISKRYKYRAICKATGMKIIKWQKEFIIHKRPIPRNVENVRGNGKTTAVLLKILMLDGLNAAEAKRILLSDPDWRFDSYQRMCWYEREHTKMVNQCREFGIPVPMFRISKFENNRF